MRLSGVIPARKLAALWLTGSAESDELQPDRALRRRAARDAFRGRAARLVIGHAVRTGGALPQPIFAASGDLLATGPVWHPSIVAAAEWRLSGALPRLLGELGERTSDAGRSPAPLRTGPANAADVVAFEALAERLDEHCAGRDRQLAEALAAASPLSVLKRFDRFEPTARTLARLDPWLAAGWLVPYAADEVIRSWLSIDRRRELLARSEEVVLNQRLAALQRHLLEAWRRLRRPALWGLLIRWYERWLRARGGAGGVLEAVRAGSWEGWTRQAREQFERSFAELCEPGLALADEAAALRPLSWQRTAAEEHYLGDYTRRLEPLVPALTLLQRELSQTV